MLVIIAVLTWVTAMRSRRDPPPRRGVRRVATAMALGIPAQGVLGGITVLTQLNPFVVALHFLLSMVLITLAVWLVRSAYRVNREPVRPITAAVVTFTFVAMWVAVWLGTMTTGSGPHAGDLDARRTGWDIVLIAHVHAYAVYAAIAGTVVALWLARSRAVVLLLGVEVIQAAIGLTQYHLGLPIGLVGLHLLGAALSIAAVANLRFSVRGVRAAGQRRSEQPVSLGGAVPAPDPGHGRGVGFAVEQAQHRGQVLRPSPASEGQVGGPAAGPELPAPQGTAPGRHRLLQLEQRHRGQDLTDHDVLAAARTEQQHGTQHHRHPGCLGDQRRQLGLGFRHRGTGEQGDVGTMGAGVVRTVLAGQTRCVAAPATER